jgi:hypothetical protein
LFTRAHNRSGRLVARAFDTEDVGVWHNLVC